MDYIALRNVTRGHMLREYVQRRAPRFVLEPEEYETVFQKKFEVYDNHFLANRYTHAFALGKDFCVQGMGLLIENKQEVSENVLSDFSQFEKLETELYKTSKKIWFQSPAGWIENVNPTYAQLQLQALNKLDGVVRYCAMQLGTIGINLHESFERRIIVQAGSEEIGYRIPKIGASKPVEPEPEEPLRVVGFPQPPQALPPKQNVSNGDQNV